MEKSKTLSKKLISLVLSLLMVLSCFSGMSLTAYAAPEETLLTTITYENVNGTVYSVSNRATLETSGTLEVGSMVAPGKFGWSNSNPYDIGSVTVKPADGYTITKVVFWNYSFSPMGGEYDSPLTDTTSPYTCYAKISQTSLNEDMSGTKGKNIAKIEVYGYEDGPLVGTVIKVGDTLTLDGDYIECMPGVSDQVTDSLKLERMEYDNYFNAWGAVFEESFAFLVAGDETPEPDGFYVSGGNGTQSHPYTLALHYAYADYLPAATDDATALAAKVVKFNGMDWYLIADNSTSATEGTVTLFAKDKIGSSRFDNSNNVYSGSMVKSYLDNLTAEGGAFADVADAIVSTDLEDVTVTGAKLWLLSQDEVINTYKLSTALNKCSNDWWLRTPVTSSYVIYVNGESGSVVNTGNFHMNTYGVRPALKLDLSKVEFNSETKTFALPTPSAYADYLPAATDDADALAAKVVKFNGYDWYLIEDNSTSETEGTVTLLAKECVGASTFGDNNTYSGSTVETYVNNWYADNISTSAKAAVSGDMFLLTTEQANAITNADVLKCSQADEASFNKWWLSSPGSNKFYAAYVNGETGDVFPSGSLLTMYGVRPALNLDLSKVEFDSETKTFTVPTPAHTHDFSYSTGYNAIIAECTADGCTLDDGTEQHNHIITLNIVAPTLTTYGQTGEGISAEATLDGLVAFNAATGLNVSATDIKYYKPEEFFPGYTRPGEELEGAPTDAGTYFAGITISNVKINETDTSNVSAYVSYTIAKADPTCTAPTGLTATYGQTLADVTLTNPSGNTAGTWAWADSRTSVGNVGTNTFKASFVPTDTANYNTKTNIDVSVTVGKADPTYTVPTGLEATYGDTLSSVTLPTGWSWANGSQKVGNADTKTFKATYTPADTDNYNVVNNIDVTVTVNKADINPTVSITGWTYGQAANSPSVSGNTGDGHVKYTYAVKGSDEFSETVPTDANTYTVKAAIAATTNYNGKSVTADFTIAKADPTSVAPTGVTATYGQTLADVTLTNPEGNTAGTWAWVDDTTSVGDAGQKTFKANFTSADTTNYNTVENVDVTVKVNPADITPTVSLEGWTYNQTAKTPSVSGNSGNGTVTYTYATKGSDSFSATVPTDTGNYTVKATIAATANYNGGTATADFTIARADITPAVTLDGWTYGEKANAPSVTGNSGNGDVTYLYKEKGASDMSCTDEVPTQAGEYTVKALIAETANYNGANAEADFTIAKAKVTITADDKSSKREADLKKLTYKVDGKILDSDDLGIKVSSNAKAAVAGKYVIKVAYTANANYDVKVVNGTYTVTDRITANERTKGKNKINSAIKATVNKNGSITAKWGAVANADKFEIYANYCSKNSEFKKIKTVKGNVHSFDITKLNGKKLDQKKSVKIYVVAYRKVNGKYEKITQSVQLHVVNQSKNYSNAKAITVKKDAFTLKVNKTATIKPTLVLKNSKKKAVEHVAKFRYQSTNKAVATVDKNGKITAVGKGTCWVYIFANNGKLKSVKVTVK